MLNVNITEEPVVIEGDDAAVVLQRVSLLNHRLKFWVALK